MLNNTETNIDSTILYLKNQGWISVYFPKIKVTCATHCSNTWLVVTLSKETNFFFLLFLDFFQDVVLSSRTMEENNKWSEPAASNMMLNVGNLCIPLNHLSVPYLPISVNFSIRFWKFITLYWFSRLVLKFHYLILVQVIQADESLWLSFMNHIFGRQQIMYNPSLLYLFIHFLIFLWWWVVILKPATSLKKEERQVTQDNKCTTYSCHCYSYK